MLYWKSQQKPFTDMLSTTGRTWLTWSPWLTWSTWLSTTGRTWLPHRPPQAFSEPFYRLPILCSGPLCNAKCMTLKQVGPQIDF